MDPNTSGGYKYNMSLEIFPRTMVYLMRKNYKTSLEMDFFPKLVCDWSNKVFS